MHPQFRTGPVFDLGANPAHQDMYFHGGTNGPDGVVLMGYGNPEKGQDFITHKLVDDPFVVLDNFDRSLFDAVHDRLDLFRIEFFV
jgi:hypothetical protein